MRSKSVSVQRCHWSIFTLNVDICRYCLVAGQRRSQQQREAEEPQASQNSSPGRTDRLGREAPTPFREIERPGRWPQPRREQQEEEREARSRR